MQTIDRQLNTKNHKKQHSCKAAYNPSKTKQGKSKTTKIKRH
jgi:hypothetical protein